MSGTARTLQQALQTHQAGDLPRAEQLYRQILRIDPQHADALHLLGVAAHQRGDQRGAIERIRQAVALQPKNAIYWGNLGSAYRSLGQLDDAAECCQRAVQLDPRHAAAHLHLGLVLLAQGNPLGAQRRFEQAAQLNPNLVEAWNSLGNSQELLQRHADAIDSYRQALRLQPQNADVHYNLGNACLAAGRTREAIAAYSAVLAARPQSPEALNNLGTALRILGRIEEAIASYQLALRFRPEFTEARNNLGTGYASLGRWDEAAACYREALRVSPQNAAALNNLGTTHNATGRLEDAVECFREACRLSPHNAEPAGNLAVALQMQGRASEADAAYCQALQINPRHHRLRVQQSLLLPPIYESLEDLHRWRKRFETNLDALHADGVTLDAGRDLLPVNFYLAYQGFNDRDLQRSVAKLVKPAEAGLPLEARLLSGRECITSGDARMGRLDAGLPEEARRLARRLRIGFLSKCFHAHTIGDLTEGLIAELPRSDFEVTVLSLGQSDDALARRIQRSADRHVVVPDQVAPAVRQIAELKLDVLYYPDAGMDPLGFTLANSRLAPVQCVSWGHPVTTGIPAMDYFISSELIEPPDADEHYTERLVRLSTLPVCYRRPVLPAALKPREAFGLPRDAHVYLCPQSLFKFHPEFDPLLREILQRDPCGRLALIEAPQATWTETLARRFDRTFGPAYSQVSFLPRQGRSDFLNLLAVSDVMLDPLHFGGGNTTYQGFACDVPIVTLPAAFMRGRATLACYRKMNLTDGVAATAGEYVDLAVRFGTDREWSAQVRERIAAASPVLFEDSQAVAELAAFFRRVVDETTK